MIFLLLAVLSSAMIAIIMRVSTDKVGGSRYVLAANYLVCALLGAAYAGFGGIAAEPAELWKTAGLGVLHGVLLLAAFLLLQISTGRNGIVLSSVFMKLGLLVPILLSVLCFGERPTAAQLAGFGLAIGAILLINLKKGEKAGSFGIVLILLLLLGGGADAMAKVFDVFGTQALSGLFLFLSFLSAFVLCMILVLAKKEPFAGKALLFGALIGVPNFFSSKFLLAALLELPAVVVYPTFSVATMLVVILGGVAFFRERLEKRHWIALGAVIAALFLLNI